MLLWDKNTFKWIITCKAQEKKKIQKNERKGTIKQKGKDRKPQTTREK